MVQNTVKINKNVKKYFLHNYYGRLKQLFDFNKLAKFILSIIFGMKFLYWLI